jgi:uncharacterized membrane protein
MEGWMPKILDDRRVALLCLLVIVVGGAIVYFSMPTTSEPGSDIYYSYVEGQRINAGQDPYARVLEGNMRDNDKYATYFPLFYYLSALTQRLGLQNYDSWIGFWRGVFLLFNIATACLLYWILYRQRAVWLAILSAAFWFFNRWSVSIEQAATLESITIFCLLLSLTLLPRHRTSAYLLFGLSLAFKQVAVWLVPLYLIWSWKMASGEAKWRWREVLLAGVTIAAIPLLTSLPFLLTDARGFLSSIAFSVTRNPATHVQAQSLDVVLGFRGPAARLLMLAVMGLASLAFWHGELGIYRASLLSMTLFVDFNPVLFLQYFTWPAVLLLPALVEGHPAPWPTPAAVTPSLSSAVAPGATATETAPRGMG